VVHFKGDGPNSGDRKGSEAITAALIGRYELTGGTHKFEVHDIFADDDHGVAVIRETATRTDGATLDVEESHMVTFNAAGQIPTCGICQPTQRRTPASSTAAENGRTEQPICA